MTDERIQPAAVCRNSEGSLFVHKIGASIDIHVNYADKDGQFHVHGKSG